MKNYSLSGAKGVFFFAIHAFFYFATFSIKCSCKDRPLKFSEFVDSVSIYYIILRIFLLIHHIPLPILPNILVPFELFLPHTILYTVRGRVPFSSCLYDISFLISCYNKLLVSYSLSSC